MMLACTFLGFSLIVSKTHCIYGINKLHQQTDRVNFLVTKQEVFQIEPIVDSS